MGEMADDLINSIMDNYDLHYTAYCEDPRCAPRCRYCGLKFYWGKDEFENSIMLQPNGKLHYCRAMKESRTASADEFPLL